MTPAARRFLKFLLGAILVVLLGSLLLYRPPQPQATDSENERVTRKAPLPERAATPDLADRPPAFTATPDARTAALILTSLEKFREQPGADQAALLLQELREDIRQAPEDEAAAAVVDFLKSGANVPTGLPFAVGPDGMMEVVPTLRLALLDLLPSLDPLAALELAREIMARRTTPDEYALSLRNLAWNDLDGDLRNELSDRFTDLLQSPWLDQPSAGVLESFDVAVEIGGGSMFEQMVTLAREATVKSNPSAGRAAFMSLDRMIVRDPALLKTAFSQDPAWLEFAPQQRASLLSRLDLADPEQRALFVRYLTATPHAAGELDYFAKAFPNANYLHGHRLVTADDAAPSISQITTADARVLDELDSLEPTVSGEAATAIQAIRKRLRRLASPETPSPDR